MALMQLFPVTLWDFYIFFFSIFFIQCAATMMLPHDLFFQPLRGLDQICYFYSRFILNPVYGVPTHYPRYCYIRMQPKQNPAGLRLIRACTMARDIDDLLFPYNTSVTFLLAADGPEY